VAEPPTIGASMGGGVDQGWYELKVAIEKHLRERLRAARETVPEGVDVETSLIGGDPAKTLTSAATTSGTLLLIGSRAYGPARRVLLGSVSSKLVRSTPCPLIVHPRGMHAEEDAPAAAPRGLQASGSLFGRAALR
jgi:nucleotide-binding universal stress UspA family protein